MDILVHVLRGLLGVGAILFASWLLSVNRKAIDWKLVISGMLMTFLIGLLVLRVPFIRGIFDVIGNGFVNLLSCSKAGATMVFGSLVDTQSNGFIFAVQVVPSIIFFSALTSMLYYFGVLQVIVKGFAWAMSKTMRLSGAESLSSAANIFLGQTEAPLVIKPFVPAMTKSELLNVMVGGMANIAGSVFGLFILFLGGTDPHMQQIFATHLLTASIMSAPAAIVISKMLYPEMEPEKINTELKLPRERFGSNVLDALSEGTTDGLKLAVNVCAMLIAFLALIFLINNMILMPIGNVTGINDWIAGHSGGRFDGFNLQFIFGVLFSPIAWLLGVPVDDILSVGSLLGTKTTANELVAYEQMSTLKPLMSEKAIIIATYALCGFANFASIGIQIGGIGALAPNQKQNLSQLGIKALIGGSFATFIIAAIAGMLVQHLHS